MRSAGVLLLTATVAAIGGAAHASTHSVLGTRSCGTLAVGIGWQVAATPNVTCSSARLLMTTYFARRANRPARAIVDRYVCTRRDLADAEQIRCARSVRLVTARSFGY